MKIAITGASGLLGSAFVQEIASKGHAIKRIDRSALFLQSSRETALQLSGANWLIHTAANTNVEQCETDIDACYRDNLILTDILVEAALRESVPIVYISSTGVYGARESVPYAEYHDAFPTTHHHRAKFLSEQAVLRAGMGSLVIRTGWLFGGAVTNPKNFVARRIEEAIRALLNREVLKSNEEQIGCPTYTHDVVQQVMSLMASGHSGIFNCVNNGLASRFDYVTEIVRLAGIPIEVVPAAVSSNRIAKVSNNESAVNWRMSQLKFKSMPYWQDSLASYINGLSIDSNGGRRNFADVRYRYM